MSVLYDVVVAANRPPIEDILNFLQAERSWIIDNLFGGRNIAEIAHGLVGQSRILALEKHSRSGKKSYTFLGFKFLQFLG